MRPVTYSSKRYVTVCVGCECLFDTVRCDQMTCSPACRVRAHRNGSMARRRSLADFMQCDPAGIGFAGAMLILRPDLEARIMSGGAKFDDLMPDLLKAYRNGSGKPWPCRRTSLRREDVAWRTPEDSAGQSSAAWLAVDGRRT